MTKTIISTDTTYAAQLLKAGEAVAIPTETVYGLAGNALNPKAIDAIFTAKKRPRDNPLIVHVTGTDMARGLGLEVPPVAEVLAKRFWPGPLTVILKKTADVIPVEVNGGLDTVAVRVPDSAIALEIIKKAGVPLAAPSANISGSPSPTTAQHVFADLNGRIKLIIDGGECKIGLESTVVALQDDGIRLFRPGAVTAEELAQYAKVTIDDSVYAKSDIGAVSPGTAHRHYSPQAQVVAVVSRTEEAFRDFVGFAADGTYSILRPEGHTLFSVLRELDGLGAKRIFVRLPKPEGVGLAVYNRVVRAAEFNVVTI